MQLNEAVEEALSINDGMVVLVGENYRAYRKRSRAAYLAGNKIVYRVPPGMRAWASIDKRAVVQHVMAEIEAPCSR